MERQEWIRALVPCGASGVQLVPGVPKQVGAHDAGVLVGAKAATYCAPPVEPVKKEPRPARRAKASTGPREPVKRGHSTQ